MLRALQLGVKKYFRLLCYAMRIVLLSEVEGSASSDTCSVV